MGFEAYTNARDATLRNGERQRAEMDELRLQRARRAAGNALQSGDLSGASNALFQGGDIEGGLSVQRTAQTRQADQREQQRTALLSVVLGLRHVPEAQRPQMLAQIGPRVSVYGITPDQLGSIGPEDLTDASLDGLIRVMGGEAPQPRVLQGARGAVDLMDPYSHQITSIRAAAREDAPEGTMWESETSNRVVPIPGYVDARRQISGANRAPPRPRSSSRSGGAGGSNRPAAPAAPSRRPWERF